MQDPANDQDKDAMEAAAMVWLTSAQPVGSNLIVASSQPSAIRTAKERYFWPVLQMEPLVEADTKKLVEE